MITYDDVTYASKVHRGRHIERLHTQAFLRGLSPAHPAGARVLDLGCGTGEALMPMALEFPKARFMGIDASGAEIVAAQALQKELSAENVEFRKADIRKLDHADLGKFDYILCHGVYSWCDEETRAAILQLIQGCLAEQGIALLSYNVLPGASFRGVAARMLRYYDKPTAAPADRSSHLRSVLKRLVGSIDYDFEHPYNVILHRELSRIQSEKDHYLFHEVLQDDTYPLLVSDLLKRAEAAGLRFVGDARFSRVSLNRLLSGNNPSQGFQHVMNLSTSQIEMEQTMDFLFGTAFRETLLCRSERALEPEVAIDSLKLLSFAGHIISDEEKPRIDDSQELFHTALGREFNVSKPLLKAAINALRTAFPNYLSFPELLSRSRTELSRSGIELVDFEENVLAGSLLEWMQRELLEYALHPPSCAERVFAHPATSAFIQWQVRNDRPLTNLFYDTVELDSLAFSLLGILNVDTDRATLRSHARNLVSSGAGGIKEGGEIVTDSERINELLEPLIDASLETLRKAALLLK